MCRSNMGRQGHDPLVCVCVSGNNMQCQIKVAAKVIKSLFCRIIDAGFTHTDIMQWDLANIMEASGWACKPLWWRRRWKCLGQEGNGGSGVGGAGQRQEMPISPYWRISLSPSQQKCTQFNKNLIQKIRIRKQRHLNIHKGKPLDAGKPGVLVFGWWLGNRRGYGKYHESSGDSLEIAGKPTSKGRKQQKLFVSRGVVACRRYDACHGDGISLSAGGGRQDQSYPVILLTGRFSARGR